MITRITNGLKFFFLLIFIIELFTPLLLSTQVSIDKNPASKHFSAKATTQNQFCYMCAEGLGTNEEGGEGHREFTIHPCFDLFLAFNQQLEDTCSSLEIIHHTLESTTPKPRLFILNCLLRI